MREYELDEAGSGFRANEGALRQCSGSNVFPSQLTANADT